MNKFAEIVFKILTKRRKRIKIYLRKKFVTYT